MSNFIKQAADILGGQANLARAMCVTPPTVNQWVKKKKPVPSGRCPQIERLTNGLIRCEDLRPEIDWDVLRGTLPRTKPTQPETRA